jgi:hypothetical protein
MPLHRAETVKKYAHAGALLPTRRESGNFSPFLHLKHIIPQRRRQTWQFLPCCFLPMIPGTPGGRRLVILDPCSSLPIVIAQRVGKRESRINVIMRTTELFEALPAFRLSGINATVIASLHKMRNIHGYCGLYWRSCPPGVVYCHLCFPSGQIRAMQ